MKIKFTIGVLLMGWLSFIPGCGDRGKPQAATAVEPSTAIGYETAEIYDQLRSTVLQLRPDDIGVPETDPSPLTVIMETGYPEAVATLVVVADGSTSLYFSNGGGVIGAGEHEAVRRAGESFLAAGMSHAPALASTEAFPLPKQDHVRFYIVTGSGVLTAEIATEELGNGQHELSPLFYEAHEVISAVREHAPE